jgi:hypothetical protein
MTRREKHLASEQEDLFTKLQKLIVNFHGEDKNLLANFYGRYHSEPPAFRLASVGYIESLPRSSYVSLRRPPPASINCSHGLVF